MHACNLSTNFRMYAYNILLMQVIHPVEKTIVYVNSLPLSSEIQKYLRETVVLNW